MIRKIVVFAISVSAMLLAEDGIRGPVPGFLYDEPAQAIRPMVGMPGAAYLGAAAVNNIEEGSVAPDGRLALGIKESKLWLFNLRNGEALELGPAGGNHRIAWNRASNAAAILANGSGRLELLRDLNSTPRVTALDAVPNGNALAVDSKGNVLVGTENAVLLVEEGGAPRILGQFGKVTGLSLDSSESTLYVADSGESAVFELRDWRNGGGATLLANANLGVTAPAGVAVSHDDRFLIVANSGENPNLVVIDRNTRSVSLTAALEFKPSRLERFGDGSLYLLNNRSNGEALQILSGAAEAKVYFVPVEE